MLQANELRIGNWIQDGVWYTIKPDDRPALSHEDFTKNFHGEYVPVLRRIENIEDISKYTLTAEPIPLTMEILRSIYQDKIELECSPSFLDNKPHFYFQNQRIYSLHQFQNLYFAMTGEELKVNLTQPLQLA